MGQGTIPDDWEGEFCRYAVCWPNSEQWLAVLRGVLTLPARGRFWDEHTGSILDAQSVIRQTFDTNLHLQEVIMACGDEGLTEIAQALNNISLSLSVNACCERSGSGGTGAVAPPFDPVEEGNPDIDPPPEGFESWEEFLQDKCAVAWNIVETLEGDLGNMAIVNFGGISLSSLAALLAIAFVTPIPFDDVVAIAGLLLTVVAEIVLATALSLVNDNEEDLVCELYNGTTSSTSRSMFLAKYSEFVASGVADPIQAFAINALMSYMVGSSVTNRLYQKDLTRNWPAVDCTGCEDVCPQIRVYTSVTEFNPPVDLPVTINSFWHPPAAQWVIQLTLTSQHTIAVEDMMGWTDFPGQNDFKFWATDNFTEPATFNSNDAPIGTIAASASGVMISNTEFSATIVCVP